MTATVIRNPSPQELLTALKTLTDEKKVVAPQPQLTNEEYTAEIEKLGIALDAGSAAGPTLVGDVRAAVEAQRAALIRQQYILLRGFVPDENGNRPMDEKATEESVTKSVVESLAAAPPTELQSELEPPDDEEDDDYDEEFDLAEQVEVLNAIDEADAAEPLKIPESILAPRVPLQLPPPVTLSPEEVMVLRASLRANLTHTVLKVLSAALQEK